MMGLEESAHWAGDRCATQDQHLLKGGLKALARRFQLARMWGCGHSHALVPSNLHPHSPPLHADLWTKLAALEEGMARMAGRRRRGTWEVWRDEFCRTVCPTDPLLPG
jgi:hypothetical protein